MRPALLSIVLLLTSDAFGIGPDSAIGWKGVKVMPKRDAVATVGERTIALAQGGPWIVQEVKGELLCLDSVQGVWVDRSQIVTLGEAIPYYTKIIDAGGESKAWAHRQRSTASEEQGDLDAAIADLGEFLQLQPGALGHVLRALLVLRKDDYDKAIADFTEAIKFNPDVALPYSYRGNVWLKKHDYGKALADFIEASRLNPKDAGACNNAAMLMATCPDQRYRNGKKAIEMATTACELREWKDAGCLDTLAAAYAEAGDFDAAQTYQSQAIELSTSNADFVERATARVALYKDHKPYREE